jgi:ATP-binding cassette subfamily C protein
MFTPIATAILFDYAIPDADRGLLVQVGLGLLAAAAGGLTFQLARGFALMRTETLADATTQAAVWDRLLNLPVPFFRQYSTGDLLERVSAISAIRQQLGGTTLQTLFASTVALLNLALLFYYSWQLALVAAALALVTIATTASIGASTLREVRRLQELEGNIFGLMVELLGSVAKLRVAGAEERAFAHWGKQYSQQQKLKLKVQRLTDSLTIFNQVLPALTSALLFAVATISIKTDRGDTGLSTGTFLAFYAAFGIAIAGATGLGDVASNILSAIVLWERVKPILEAVPEVDAQKTDPGQLSGKIALDRVTFSYRGGNSLVLDEVSIHAEPGEFVALVGASGSGKSTVFRLLLGFETPHSGKVCYDGQDLKKLNIHALRRQLGVVLQSSRLNSASIFENIAGSALIGMDEAWEASRQAGLADDIAAMPMQMHTVISEGGSNISGGQRQRLFIARALALKPRILLLDEATSALDNRTQALVTESLNSLQVTRIVIAHRLSTIRSADRIYVFEAGQVVQQGRFEELINSEGLFARLMQRQLA